jgi:hypothetical protein
LQITVELRTQNFLHPDVLGAVANALKIRLVVHEYQSPDGSVAKLEFNAEHAEVVHLFKTPAHYEVIYVHRTTPVKSEWVFKTSSH